jgi:hypothetical protein
MSKETYRFSQHEVSHIPGWPDDDRGKLIGLTWLLNAYAMISFLENSGWRAGCER